MNHIKNFTRTALTALSLSAAFASPSPARADGHTPCMGAVLAHVLEAFERQRAEGLVAIGPNGPLKLGRIEQDGVSIGDIHKAAYRVRVMLSYVDDRSSNLTLDTTVNGVNYETCAFNHEEPQFHAYERRLIH